MGCTPAASFIPCIYSSEFYSEMHFFSLFHSLPRKSSAQPAERQHAACTPHFQGQEAVQHPGWPGSSQGCWIRCFPNAELVHGELLGSGPAPSPPAKGSAPGWMLGAQQQRTQLCLRMRAQPRLHCTHLRSATNPSQRAQRRWERGSASLAPAQHHGSPRPQPPDRRQRSLQPRQSSRHGDVSELRPEGWKNHSCVLETN